MGRGKILLDIGSGYGRLLEYLKGKGFRHVLGLEPDFRFLRRGHFPSVCGKGEQAPFKDESFDAVFSIGVLSYILEDSKRIHLFDEIRRLLKKEGVFFLSCFLISSDDYHRTKYLEGEKKYGTHGIFESDSGGIFRHSGEDELKELLHNFRILRWKIRPFTTMNNREARGVTIEAQRQ
ncbi:MAG: class I SAM-dependent methyltransferase [Candidatus Aminicenantes bacterium]